MANYVYGEKPTTGNWYATLWGAWTDDQTQGVPDGFIQYGDSITPTVVSPTLDTKTATNIRTAADDASKTGNTSLVNILNGALYYGTGFINLLTKAGVIKSPTDPISLDNLDATKAEQFIKSGQLTYVVENKTPANNQPVNSTYFGIDFSKPLTWVVVVLAGWGLFKLFNSSPNMPMVQSSKK